MGAFSNPHEMAANSDALGATWTDRDRVEAQRRAALAVCDLAGNAPDALIPLAALGLINPLARIPQLDDARANPRNLAASATHGTAAGLGWHRRMRVPLCGPCRAWGASNENGAK